MRYAIMKGHDMTTASILDTSAEAPADLGSAFESALTRLESIDREMYPDDWHAAGRTVRDARQALEAAHGPAAVRLAEAQIRHRAILDDLGRLQAIGRDRGIAMGLEGRERVAARQVGQAAAETRQEQERAASRELLEAAFQPLLDELTATLTEARTGLADAVQAAQSALAAVHEQAAQYREAALEARDRLAEAGFDSRRKFDGRPFPSTPTPLRVQGADWPSPDPVAAIAWATARSVSAFGQRGQLLAAGIRPHIGASTPELELLLAEHTR